jgi:hypothetical protein
MKFHELAVGQRFEMQGETFVKVSPLVAIHEQSDTRRLIRRSADVRLLGEAAAKSRAASPDRLPAGRVVAAFETFYARCLQSLDDVAPRLGQPTLASLRGQIEEARRQFLDSLESGS